MVCARRKVFELRRVKRRRQRRATIKTLHNSGDYDDTKLKCHRDHRGGLLRIRGTFGARPPSRVRVTASFRRFQSGFYHLENASKTTEGIGRRAPKRSQGVYSMRARCPPRLKNVREAGAEESRGQPDRHIQTYILSVLLKRY